MEKRIFSKENSSKLYKHQRELLLEAKTHFTSRKRRHFRKLPLVLTIRRVAGLTSAATLLPWVLKARRTLFIAPYYNISDEGCYRFSHFPVFSELVDEKEWKELFGPNIARFNSAVDSQSSIASANVVCTRGSEVKHFKPNDFDLVIVDTAEFVKPAETNAILNVFRGTKKIFLAQPTFKGLPGTYLSKRRHWDVERKKPALVLERIERIGDVLERIERVADVVEVDLSE